MSLFKPAGFDSVISKSVTLTNANILVETETTLLIDGFVKFNNIGIDVGSERAHKNGATLIVNGEVQPETCDSNITIHNICVAGVIQCNMLKVEGTLTIKAGAKVTANQILYNQLVIERNAIINGTLIPLSKT